MSLLNNFMDSGKEVHQVTQNEWVSIMRDQHVNECSRAPEEFKNHTLLEVKCYHEQEVKQALKSNLNVSEEVLSDYPKLKQIIQNEIENEQAKQDRINSVPVFTDSIFNLLDVGNKITVNGVKVTIHSKDDKSIIARIYKKQRQATELKIGDRYNIVIGWN